MQAIWNGVIGFGLVNIPVRLYSPAKEELIDLDFLHKSDHSPVRYARICRKEEQEIEWDEIVRGYKVRGKYVVLNDDDFKKANARKTRAIDIVHFAEADEIDPIYYDKPYFLEPDPKAKKAYALLREALEKTGKVGIATFVLRTREHVAVVRAHGDVLVLHQLRFAHEITSPDSLALPGAKAFSGKELEIAVSLIKRSTAKFKPNDYKDRYLKELMTIIRQKSKGLKPKKHGKEPTPTRERDLILVLKKSLGHERVR